MGISNYLDEYMARLKGELPSEEDSYKLPQIASVQRMKDMSSPVDVLSSITNNIGSYGVDKNNLTKIQMGDKGKLPQSQITGMYDFLGTRQERKNKSQSAYDNMKNWGNETGNNLTGMVNANWRPTNQTAGTFYGQDAKYQIPQQQIAQPVTTPISSNVNFNNMTSPINKKPFGVY